MVEATQTNQHRIVDNGRKKIIHRHAGILGTKVNQYIYYYN